MPRSVGVRHEGAGRGGGHPAVDAVEAPGAVQEIGRRLRRAADPRELRDLVGLDPHLVERVDDLLRDDVVAAAEAQRGLAALVAGLRQADVVRLRGGRSGRRRIRGRAHASSPPFCASEPPARDAGASLRTPSITVVASRGRPLYWRTDTKRVASSGCSSRRIVSELPVAVLLDDVDALVAPHPVDGLGVEGQRAEPAVVERHAERRGELVAGLRRAVVGRAVREDARRRAGTVLDLGPRHHRPRRLELLHEAVDVVDVVLRLLGVLRALVVARAAREVTPRRRSACPAASGTECRRRRRPCTVPRCPSPSRSRRRRAPCRGASAPSGTGTGRTSSCSCRGRGPS